MARETARIWDKYLSPQDRKLLLHSVDDRTVDVGTKAAILSVDNYRGGVGDAPEPLLASVQRWPGSTGLAGWTALGHVEGLLRTARSFKIPVIHVTGLPEEASGMPGWNRRSLHQVSPQQDSDGDERHRRRFDIVEQAAPLPGEVVLRKNSPSAFFGTPLASHLFANSIDTLFVCGQSTSGCVRATVVDGRSFRLRMIVVEDCVYDRYEASAAISLFDMHLKYADVVSLETAIGLLAKMAN